MLAVGGTNGMVTLWNFQQSQDSRSVLGSFMHQFGNASIAFSPDVSLLALGFFDGKVVIREIANGRDLASLKVRNEEITSVAFSPDGKQLASATRLGSVHIWAVAH